MNKALLKKLIFLFTLIAILCICLSSCSQKGSNSWLRHIFSPQEDVEEGPLAPEAELTSKAMHYFDIARYQLAETEFKKIRDRYPFSPYATVAELRLADCKYFQGLYEEAIPLYQEFENLHPTNEAIPYVIFQIGSCYYNLMDTPDRDQTNTYKMIEAYDRLIKRYPKNPFITEAKKRIKEGRALLAEHEWVVAQWYKRTGFIRQSVKRLENIITIYPDTPIYEKAAKELAKERLKLAHMTKETPTENIVLPDTTPWWEKLWPF